MVFQSAFVFGAFDSSLLFSSEFAQDINMSNFHARALSGYDSQGLYDSIPRNTVTTIVCFNKTLTICHRKSVYNIGQR